MSYRLAKPKYDVRKYLTKEEAEIIDKADAAKKIWLELNKECASIKNRAIQRAKYKIQP